MVENPQQIGPHRPSAVGFVDDQQRVEPVGDIEKLPTDHVPFHRVDPLHCDDPAPFHRRFEELRQQIIGIVVGEGHDTPLHHFRRRHPAGVVALVDKERVSPANQRLDHAEIGQKAASENGARLETVGPTKHLFEIAMDRMVASDEKGGFGPVPGEFFHPAARLFEKLLSVRQPQVVVGSHVDHIGIGHDRLPEAARPSECLQLFFIHDASLESYEKVDMAKVRLYASQ